ncbi:MAG: 4Fe-4S dicluster domain-containing protein [Pseudomonadota bacterium]
MMQPQTTDNASARVSIAVPDQLAPVREMVQACIQCGTCSGSCPNAFAMDITPRRMWRMVLTGQMADLFSSKTFMLCSVCYACTLRCPRGLPLTDAMSALKRIAARENRHRSSTQFYLNFMESVRRHGRVREMEFMTLYFFAMKNPLLPLQFASLGMRLMAKGKVSLQLPSKGKGKLDTIFRNAEAMEAKE